MDAKLLRYSLKYAITAEFHDECAAKSRHTFGILMMRDDYIIIRISPGMRFRSIAQF